MGGPCPPPPPFFGTEQALNAEVYRALSACSYSDTAHISIWTGADPEIEERGGIPIEWRLVRRA